MVSTLRQRPGTGAPLLAGRGPLFGFAPFHQPRLPPGFRRRAHPAGSTAAPAGPGAAASDLITSPPTCSAAPSGVRALAPSSHFHHCTVPNSRDPVAARHGSAHAVQKTSISPSPCAFGTRARQALVAVFHTRSDPPQDPDSSRPPPRSARQSTKFVWPFSTAVQVPASTSHSRTLQSLLPEASSRCAVPLPTTASELTMSAWPRSTPAALPPLPRLHNLISPVIWCPVATR